MNRDGVHTLAASSIDASQQKWETKENPPTERATPNLGSDNWKWNPQSPSQNDKVSSLAVFGDKLFIGLSTVAAQPEPDTGGVAVYDFINPANSKAPDKDWDQVDVLALVVDTAGKKVWAVSKTGLILANPDGSKGAQMKTAPVPVYDSAVDNGDYDKTPLLPADNISDACFVGPNLVISTTDQGLIYRLAPVSQQLSP